MKITWAILATLTASSFLTAVRADEGFPAVVTKGFHTNHKGLEETTDEKRGTRFSQEEAKNYNSNELNCVEKQIGKLKEISGALKDVEQVTIVLNDAGQPLERRYVKLETKQDCFFGDHWCGHEKKILEVGGIVSYADGKIPADCSEVNTAAILRALHKVDTTVIESNQSVSNRRGDKSRSPAGYFSNGSESDHGSGNGSGRAGSGE